MQKLQGFSEAGNTIVTTSGILSTTKVQGSFPGSTITVYLAGTVTLASIYSDDANSPTPKANPFVSAADGTWFAYAANGIYDVKFSGTGIVTPFTLGGFSLGVGGSGVPSSTFALLPTSKAQNAGNLARVTDTFRGLWMDSGTQWVKQGPTINVMDFGAVPDGVTVSTTAIQNALNALNPGYGGILYFPVPPGAGAGSYVCGPLTIPAGVFGVTFKGESTIGSIISYIGASGSLFTIASDLDHIKFEDLYIQATAHTDSQGWGMDFTGGTLAGAKVITGITQANPAVVTSAAHGYSNGDAVYLSGVVGMIQVNNNWYVVAGVTANTFQLTTPNTQGVDSTGYGAYASAGTAQKLTLAYVVRSFFMDKTEVHGFYNGIRLGQALNSRISRGLIAKTQAAGIGIQVGDAGQQATSTALSSVYVSGFNSSDIWNKFCSGLYLDVAIAETATVGLRADAPTYGSMYQEAVTTSIDGTQVVDITILNDPSAWGTIGLNWGSAGQQASRLRSRRQWATVVALASAFAETADSTLRTFIFDTAILNKDGDYSTGTGLYTVFTPGIYRVQAQITITQLVNTNQFELRIVTTGTPKASDVVIRPSITQNYPSFTLHCLVFAQKNDTIQLQHAGNAVQNYYGDNDKMHTIMTIERIG